MGILDETRFVERLSFFNGQRLFASDLQGIEAFHREMRWLHNRSLHQPGIGNGFAVTGNRDDREVRIGPGYAIDALGREIVLTRPAVEQVPPVAGESGGGPVFYDLAVSYPDDASLEAAETREGICLPRGAVRLREEPVLCWIRLKRAEDGLLQPADPTLRQQIQDGLRIVLARIEVLECKLRQPVSLSERRDARPSRQPYIACGERNLDGWDEVVTVLQGENDRFFVLSVTERVDTSAAGFLTTPFYSVRFSGTRMKLAEGDDPRYQIGDAAPNVLETRADGFTVNLLLTLIVLSDEAVDPVELFADWRVVWMGVE
ncbi:MAG TPA: hypothetical protein VLQ45_15075 [Thermoanaerobaculia bacterium]|nr:hypothetical protein [Thermoanaerobaculia bacterium]